MSDYYDHLEARLERLSQWADTWTPKHPVATPEQEAVLRSIARQQVGNQRLYEEPVTTEAANE